MSLRTNDSVVHEPDCPYSSFLTGSLSTQVSPPPGSHPSLLTPACQALGGLEPHTWDPTLPGTFKEFPLVYYSLLTAPPSAPDRELPEGKT